MIAEVHRDLALLVAVAVGLVAAVALADVTTGRLHRRWLDRTILVALGLLATGGASGILLLAGGSRPADPLHYLYAVAAVVALPIALAWGGPSAGRRPLVILVAAAVLAGLVLRLFQTGG